MASRRYPKRTKMRPSIRWISPGLLCAVVIVAALGSLRANGEKNLCDKFKFGEQKIVLMAQTDDTFYILAADNTGYKAPLKKFQFVNDTASLDLAGLESFTLDTKGVNQAKSDTGKGVFLSWTPLNDDASLRPWLGLHVAFVTADHKQITFVPVDNKKQDKVLNFNIDATSIPSSDVFISEFKKKGKAPKNDPIPYYSIVRCAKEDKLNIQDYLLSSNQVQFAIWGWKSNFSMSTLDSGWRCNSGGKTQFCGIKNAEKKVFVYQRSHPHYKKPMVVPFEDFFKCHSDALKADDLKAAKFDKTMITIVTIIGIACVLVLIALFALFCILRKGKSKTASKEFDPNSTQYADSNGNSSTSGTSNASTTYKMVQTVRSKASRKLKVKKAGKTTRKTKSCVMSPYKGKAKYKIGKR